MRPESFKRPEKPLKVNLFCPKVFPRLLYPSLQLIAWVCCWGRGYVCQRLSLPTAHNSYLITHNSSSAQQHRCAIMVERNSSPPETPSPVGATLFFLFFLLHAISIQSSNTHKFLSPSCYAPATFEGLQKQLKKAVYMYNHEKPHRALNRMTPVQYRTASSVDIENNSSQVQSYFPMSTENHHHQLHLMNLKKKKTMSNSVNVI